MCTGHKTILLFISALLLLPRAVMAEQYRSKLLLNPGQELTESADVSIRELEASFNDMQRDYSKASAGTQLARHYVQQGEYEKAIDYYQSALSTQGLAQVVQADLRRELADVYLQMKLPQQALDTLQPLGAIEHYSEPALLLTYGRVQFALGNYLRVADALDRLLILTQPEQQALYQQIVALAYSIQDYERSAATLKVLLQRYPQHAEYWFQLVSMLLKRGQNQQALEYLMVARMQGIAFSEQNTLLLASLYTANGNPYTGAKTLQEAMLSGAVTPTGERYQTLFEYWLQAQEREPATRALAQAAKLTADAELYLYWAHLLLEQAQWAEMNVVVRELCECALDPRLTGRANVMLGISEYRLGNKSVAYRAFANATLSGGVNTQAGHWLAKLEAEGVEGTQPSSASGPCQPATP